MAQHHDDRVGTQIADRYRIDRVIGKGGMGVVYKGVHLWTGRPVAVKLLAIERDPTVTKRFLREARLAASVRHPHLVEVLDVGETSDGQMFLVLELLRGESLRSHIERLGAMRAEDALDVLVPILDALGVLHEAGVIHRDVKPANIFLSLDGRGHVVPKLLDFGLSKTIEADDELTVTGALMGTPSYMSPEQARGQPDVGTSADIWAMGVVLFQCLSGTRPFEAPTVTGLLYTIATERPPSLAQLVPHLPRPIAAIVDRALAYEPKTRWASATELADALVDGALAAGWPLTCRIPAGPRIELEPERPSLPHDTVSTSNATPEPDPDATPWSTASSAPKLGRPEVGAARGVRDASATPRSTSASAAAPKVTSSGARTPVTTQAAYDETVSPSAGSASAWAPGSEPASASESASASASASESASEAESESASASASESASASASESASASDSARAAGGGSTPPPSGRGSGGGPASASASVLGSAPGSGFDSSFDSSMDAAASATPSGSAPEVPMRSTLPYVAAVALLLLVAGAWGLASGGAEEEPPAPVRAAAPSTERGTSLDPRDEPRGSSGPEERERATARVEPGPEEAVSAPRELGVNAAPEAVPADAGVRVAASRPRARRRRPPTPVAGGETEERGASDVEIGVNEALIISNRARRAQ